MNCIFNEPQEFPPPPTPTRTHSQVETLNVVTDSNKLLREERDRLAGYVKDIEAKKQQLESDMIPLRESNKQLTAQKDALVAEKTALR